MTCDAYFPEGTSSNGQQVLPFKSALLAPVAGHKHPISVSALQYALAIGDVHEEVCYWKDMTLLTHLLNLLSKQEVAVRVRFSQVEPEVSDRKVLARQLHAEISKLNNSIRSSLFDALKSPNPRTYPAVEWRVQGCQVLAGRGRSPVPTIEGSPEDISLGAGLAGVRPDAVEKTRRAKIVRRREQSLACCKALKSDRPFASSATIYEI